MRALLPLLLVLATPAASQPKAELARWRAEAARVTIVRDDWGIAHVRGGTDADAVFGMIYAQAEDDFNRVETNYMIALGRTAEAEGEKAIWADLRARLYMDPADLQARYRASPAWLRRLMDAWADGLNYYLATHPEVRPRAIRRFEPWMALSFTEGSIGGDIERIDLAGLEAFYRKDRPALVLAAPPDPEPRGSNGIAIAPARSEGGRALLLINPHTSFFFRSELQVTSGEGLNAYGAATWGQFFIYQGFNSHAGWMHTSSGVDSVDEFLETMVERSGRYFYKYGNELRPVQTSTVTLPYRTADGRTAARTFTIYRTHHGPVVRAQGGKWVTFAMMHKPIEALEQSFLRTKARDYSSFLRVAALQANSSNNTLFADDKGEIAYLHPQFIPARDDRFDYTKPVDGSDPATDWRGLLPLQRIPHVLNPASGFVFNSNNWPWNAAGPGSLRASEYPRYVEQYGENPRGQHALRMLMGERRFSLDGLRAAAYDSYQPAFARLVPGLVAAWDAAPAGALNSRLADPVARLRGWDYRWSDASVPNTLANFWGDEMVRRAAGGAWGIGLSSYDKMDAAPASVKLEALAAAIDRLTRDFGRWEVPWGEVNRFQRVSPAIDHPFTDAGPSIPVGFSSARWGSLASFGAAPRGGSKKWYGTSGNSFVAIVEFGPRVRAVAVTAGGESGHPESRHFNDQAQRYATGDLRPVYFWPDQLRGHTERTYRPGQ
ncbi:MAG: acyl-homoserine-lactone acylase [Sphingomonadales bacterium]|jgi:acyl-homoserine-lactone acylase|nr:acyl-homoserine-lactone acylase [Sphingomonadales bacterium]